MISLDSHPLQKYQHEDDSVPMMELLGGTLACFLLVWVDQIPNRKLRIMKKERINTYKNY